MNILLLGDVHGNWHQLNKVLRRAFEKNPNITHVIQVGDFGYAWPGSKAHRIEVETDAEFLWLDGNHENFTQLQLDGGQSQPGWKHCPRGSLRRPGAVPYPERSKYEDHMIMFFGGATSIDKNRRTPGYEWWNEENITYRQMTKALNLKLTKPNYPDIICSHDCPDSFSFVASMYKNKPDPNRIALDQLLEKFTPKFWFFGHHHDFAEGEDNGTKWFCCPIIDSGKYMIFDGETVKYSWEGTIQV